MGSYSFANTVTDIVTLKDGNTVVVRKLGHRARREAVSERQKQGMQTAATMGPGFAEMQAKSLEAQGGVEKVLETVKKNPLLKYDIDIVLRTGIVSWSLSDKPTPEQIDELDSGDAEQIARRIVEMSEPPSQEEVKNG